LLYALTGLVLAGGGVWFVQAAPDGDDDPRIAGWRATAERLLPDLPSQAVAETIVLNSANGTERTVPVDGGSYSLSMVCAGTGQVRVRVSTAGDDSGRAVQCAEDPVTDRIRIALAEELYIQVTAENETGGAVFRWRLERARGF
jgi:hypothetical protein